MLGLGLTLPSRPHMTSVWQHSTPAQDFTLSKTVCISLHKLLSGNICEWRHMDTGISLCSIIFSDLLFAHLVLQESLPPRMQRSLERKWSYHTRPVPFMCTLQMQTVISVHDSCAGETRCHENETLGSRQQGLRCRSGFVVSKVGLTRGTRMWDDDTVSLSTTVTVEWN